MTAYIPEVGRIAERNATPQNRRTSNVFIVIDLNRKEALLIERAHFM
jgi:hypothetical protein